jgi:leucyl aminopeptidase
VTSIHLLAAGSPLPEGVTLITFEPTDVPGTWPAWAPVLGPLEAGVGLQARETALLQGLPGRRSWLRVALGEARGSEAWKRAAGVAIREARDLEGRHVVLDVTAFDGSLEELALALDSALYTFTEDRGTGSGDEPEPEIARIDLVVTTPVEAAVDRVPALARATRWVRDLTNRPSNRLTASMFAEEARKLAAERGLGCEILDRAELERLNCGLLLGVNAGSTEPPCMIVLTYSGGEAGAPPLALVGKGVTFDTGGICIKPAEGMDEMKSDMAGAATALGVIAVAAELKLPVNLVVVAPVTDNAPGGGAQRPGDIRTSHAGLTVEIIDTDAEGRLILGDGLGYARSRFQPRAMLDMATLTGSIIVALGPHVTGLFTPEDRIRDLLMAASETTGERLWPMPMWEVYDDFADGEIADLKNADERRGDAIAGAKFLQRFAGDTPWAHLDIAGPSWLEDEGDYLPKGATAHPLRTLVNAIAAGL